jgi:phosphoserine phosphatase
VNVYDFDHTIYDGDSTLDFWRFVLAKRPYLAALLPVQAWGVFRYLAGIGSKETMKEHFFRFLRFIPARNMAAQFWERNRRKLKGWYLAQKQDTDVIISASPEFLLEPIVKNVLGCALIASTIDPRTGTYQGKNCYGEEKVARFSAVYGGEKIDNFYSDSWSDAPLARVAARSFMVKGSRTVPWQGKHDEFA